MTGVGVKLLVDDLKIYTEIRTAQDFSNMQLAIDVLGMLSKTTLIAAGAGLAGAAFITYCFYFDKKRHLDPGFKQKLREKRAKSKTSKSSTGNRSSNPMPDFNDPSQMQDFFLQEVQLGEELLAEGDFENAVEHLSNAVTLCGQPQQLLQILQQTLPPQVYVLLVQRLPQTGKRIMSAAQAQFGVMEGADAQARPELAEPDLE